MDPRQRNNSGPKKPKNDDLEETTEFETQASESEFGQFLLKYKSLLIGMVVAIVLLGTGGALYKKQLVKNQKAKSEALYEFVQTSLVPYQKGEVKEDQVMKAYENFQAKVDYAPVGVGTAMDLARLLFEKGQLENAQLVLDAYPAKLKDHPELLGQVLLSLSAIYEDRGLSGKATALLEEHLDSVKGTAEEGVRFQLVRLYLNLKNSTQAQVHLQHLKDHAPNSKMTELAEVFFVNGSDAKGSSAAQSKDKKAKKDSINTKS